MSHSPGNCCHPMEHCDSATRRRLPRRPSTKGGATRGLAASADNQVLGNRIDAANDAEEEVSAQSCFSGKAAESVAKAAFYVTAKGEVAHRPAGPS